MKHWELPTFQDVDEKKVRAEPLSALEQFIWDETPGAHVEWAFRESLHAAIMDAVAQMLNSRDGAT